VLVSIDNGNLGGGTVDGSTFGPYQGDWGAPITIHQIPEPFTMALMGLGGLVLIRRRRA
jgi:hypothetical protein